MERHARRGQSSLTAPAVAPRVVVLEDLHWADEPTLLLLQHLAQTIATTPLLVVGTYGCRARRHASVRQDARSPGAAAARDENLSATSAHVRRRVDAARGMSSQPPPSSLTRVIFQETEGNPFFVEEVFQHLSEDGKLFDAGARGGPIFAWRRSRSRKAFGS
jgi:predicted ATPase